VLTAEENDELCRVGPDTPMGKVLRRYWVPAFQLADLPTPDCPPIRVTVLGENFVAFRDTNGQLGFLEELCCHRGASLTLGRVEDCGIRCLYHGWKYTVDGTITETPNLPDSRFKERVKHPAYPVREGGGLGWVYLGPPGTEPEFPRYPFLDITPEEAMVGEMVLDCNWVQVQEGSIDSSHIGVLHLDTIISMRPGPRAVGSKHFEGDLWDDSIAMPGTRGRGANGGGDRGTAAGGDGGPRGQGAPQPSGRRPEGVSDWDNAPRIQVENTPFGFHYAAIRSVPDQPGQRYVRVTAFLMPFIAYIPPGSGPVIVVPRDDYTCSTMIVGRRQPGAAAQGPMRGIDPTVWGPLPDQRRFHAPAQDREAMAAGKSFAGYRGGNRIQDAAVHLSMGPMYNRANEHLVPPDVAVVRFRRLLQESARLVAEGKDPVGICRGFDTSKIKAESGLIDADARWQELVPDNLGPGVAADASTG
jgi:phenylpropionate dioxygenase-like ring-hydroxylating dioxygenase large terminal subunit